MELFISNGQCTRFNLVGFIGLVIFNCVLREIIDNMVRADHKFGLQVGLHFTCTNTPTQLSCSEMADKTTSNICIQIIKSPETRVPVRRVELWLF